MALAKPYLDNTLLSRSDFHYELPEALIAQYPLPERSASRLLCLNGTSGEIRDSHFSELPGLLNAGDLLVFNNTKVIPARLFGHKRSGGKVEVLVERLLDDRQFLAQVRASKSPKPGMELILTRNIGVEVIERIGDLFKLRLHDSRPAHEVLEQIGHMPLPPYITRGSRPLDSERYQTIYACKKGAVAAPTAGLHFDQELQDRLATMGVESAYVTLHVGAGTFQPLRVDDIKAHQMHSEAMEVSDRVCEKIAATRQRGGRVIAVGTTVVRCLETAYQQTASRQGEISPFNGETDIYITPGYKFMCVDALITNFHLPESTLLMLVCAFAGMDEVLSAYHHAVENKYRFYSYGDAMFVTKKIQD